MRTVELPVPSAQERAASELLLSRILATIGREGGWIGFDRYMQIALYEPGLGYYSGGSRKFGPEGDFVTAPETSPLFGACLAQQCVQWFEQAPPCIVEFGAGSGALAAQLLAELGALGVADVDYRIVEVSGELRERQRETIAARAPERAAGVRWLDRWPESVAGVVLGNELLDAMPARVFRLRSGRVLERGVGLEDGRLGWVDRAADAGFERAVRAALGEAWGEETGWPQDYVSEIGEQGLAWVAEAARRLELGAILLIDYGFPRAELYHPQRATGTLMCHYRHYAHADPFLHPGLQDITTHVDFSAVSRAAGSAGLDALGYTSQAHLLLNLGLLEQLARTPAEQAARYLPQSQAVQRLVSESEMGELFKAIAFGRGVADEAIGFSRGDRRGSL
jgi:SAM-dependent MidA family methyltransferase